MDFNQLVEEIVARVAAKIEAESAPVAAPVDSGKPKLLILTQEHGTLCHQMLESPRLAEYYQTECALLQDYQCALESYEAVILFGLDLELMGRLSGGLCDTGFPIGTEGAALGQEGIRAAGDRRAFKVCGQRTGSLLPASVWSADAPAAGRYDHLPAW